MPADDVIRVSILADVQNAVAGFGKAALAAGASVLAFKKLIEVGKECVQQFIESEQAQTKLAAALRITGQYSAKAVSEMVALAQALAKTTTYTDEAAMEASGLLMQLGNLSTKGVEKLLPRLADFASTMGMDLVSAAELVGKTLGGTTNTLGRYGIVIQEGLGPQEKFSAILSEMETKFGGMATELAKTTGGQLENFKKQIDDLKESGGEAIAIFLNPVVTTLNQIATEVSNARTRWEDFNRALANQKLEGTLEQLRAQRDALKDYERTFTTPAFKSFPELMTKAWKTLWYELSGRGFTDLVTGTAGKVDLAIEEYNKKIAELEAQLRTAAPAADVIAKKNDAITISSTKAAAAVEKEAKAVKQLLHWGSTPVEAGAMYLEPKVTSRGISTPSIGRESGLLRPSNEETQNWVEQYVNSLKRIDEANQKSAEEAAAAAEKTKKAWEQTFEAIEDVTSRLGAISDQYYRNQEMRLDNEYEKRRENIEATITDETKKAAALEALDEEFEDRRKKIAHDQAVAEKAFGIFNTIVDTAQAVVKALATLGPIAGPIMAGVIAGMGAAQTALIAAEPVPALARGGEFDVPPGYPGDSYRMQVSSGEHVSVTPAGESGQRIIINLDGRAIADFVTKGTRDRRIIVDAGAVA